MSSFRTSSTFAPVPSAFAEIAPLTLVGTFRHVFAVGPDAPIYIRPGQLTQQDYLNVDGAEWMLYSRAVLFYRIETTPTTVITNGGVTLIVELGDLEVASVPVMREWKAFHLVPGDIMSSENSGIELPGLMARFRLSNEATNGGQVAAGSIIVRSL